MSIYIVQHVHELFENREDVKLIGVYSSKNAALAAIARLTTKPGFETTPDCFDVDEYEMDADHWSDGYGEVTGSWHP